MIIVLVVILLLMVLAGPAWWAKYVLKKYNHPQPHIPGSGGELVEHLISRFELADVKLDSSGEGDFYNPQSKEICLNRDIIAQRSLTSVATAAHEFGHALQDHENYPPLKWRGQLVTFAAYSQQLTSVMLLMSSVAFIVAPGIGRAMLLIAVLGMLMNCVVHLVTLPVEINASFARALPLLQQGEYVSEQDYPAVRRILTACAMTYLAASLMSLLSVWTWLRFLRR